jgi:sugar/nucleoside kinase (ribokinase family)
MKRIGCGGILVKDTFCGPLKSLPGPGELVAVDAIRTKAGGCAANVAIDLCKQNLSADLMGCVGRDAAGEALVKALLGGGVNCDRLYFTEEYPTSETVILLVEGEDRRYIHTFGATQEFSVYHIDGDWLAGLDLFYLGGLFAMPALEPDELLTLLQFCREHGVVTIVDVVLPTDFTGADEMQRLLINWPGFCASERNARRRPSGDQTTSCSAQSCVPSPAESRRGAARDARKSST